MSTFNILLEKNRLTLTENEEVKLNPISQFEFITYPINEELPILILDKDTYLGLLLKVYQFNATLDGVEPFNSEVYSNFVKQKMNFYKMQQTTVGGV